MLEAILEDMMSGYKDLELFACHQQVSLDEVEDLLVMMEPDTAEAVCLRILLKYAK
jgi:hypothetical protein